jgi:hypothetical protein
MSRLERLGNIAALVAGLWLLGGCSGLQVPDGAPDREDVRRTERKRIHALQSCLSDLGPKVSRNEAERVSETALRTSEALAREYRLVRPAVFHNLLIQVGLRDRGLCYHWTEDLMRALEALALESLRLHWGVAHRGSHLREHNSVVITATGQPFEQGVILDPWRHSGQLYWIKVAEDEYPWQALPPEQW